MKELHGLLQEVGQALQEYDPIAFENAERIIRRSTGSCAVALQERGKANSA